MQEIQRLLGCTPVIVGPCELDLLVFLYRHPRTLLTNEQLAAFVGYDMKQIAKSIDAFIDAGLLERTQNSLHAARMYLLVLQGEESGGLKTLLRMASTREGRRDILQVLAPGRPKPPTDLPRAKGSLRAIA
jgi:DNA-binding MarR family transcriptional regulator